MMHMISNIALIPFLLFHLLLNTFAEAAGGGSWKLLQKSIGISAMHMQLLHNDRVVIFDRTDFGRSNLTLLGGQCRRDPRDQVLKVDCTAHSVEYDVAANTFRPLMVMTDTWCSSGSILPDGRQIVIGGRRQFNYEFYPKNSASSPDLYSLPFLSETNDPGRLENNLYPFLRLNVDGNLFIFANNRAIQFDYKNNKVVRTYPVLLDGDPRNYPSCGSSVLLPINLRATKVEAEVLVCGGAPKGSFAQARKGTFVGALATCGRIKITDPNSTWSVETMPKPRVMGDMVMLPNADVLIINGAAAGSAGWELGRDPVLKPVLYRPGNPPGRRFELQNPTTIPRMYHSSAIPLRDGRVLVGGSNPHMGYSFYGVKYPTELSLEAFSPPYLDPENLALRPKIEPPYTQLGRVRYGERFAVYFTVLAPLAKDEVAVTVLAPPFPTHAFSMNQRLLVVGGRNVVAVAGKSARFAVEAVAPASANLAPPGYYMLFVVHKGVPSEGIWIKITT